MPSGGFEAHPHMISAPFPRVVATRTSSETLKIDRIMHGNEQPRWIVVGIGFDGIVGAYLHARKGRRGVVRVNWLEPGRGVP